jgi:hypothetical protein
MMAKHSSYPQKKVSLVLCCLLTLPYLIGALIVFFITGKECWRKAVEWFDPRFLQYNVVLLLLAVLIVPWITYFYVTGMKEEKRRRLEKDLLHEYEPNRKYIDESLDSQFKFQNYLGSMFILMLIITMGVGILLLLKPLPVAENLGEGLDYSKGANFLLMGPFIENYANGSKNYYHQLVVSLTAFQFGFLGAYVYFLSYLVRSFFTLDLTSQTFVFSAIRMMTSSILALVLSFILVTFPKFQAGSPDTFLRFLPFLAFFLGFFPSRALRLLDNVGGRILRTRGPKYNATPLSQLPGMSLAYEVRLEREGFDNLEDLSHLSPGNALDLAIQTGFSYRQLGQWIDHAWLYGHLGPEDYETFKKRTGIINRQELIDFLTAWRAQDEGVDADEYLARALDGKGAEKIKVICNILKPNLKKISPGESLEKESMS